jgi:hypothetical protein
MWQTIIVLSVQLMTLEGTRETADDQQTKKEIKVNLHKKNFVLWINKLDFEAMKFGEGSCYPTKRNKRR